MDESSVRGLLVLRGGSVDPHVAVVTEDDGCPARQIVEVGLATLDEGGRYTQHDALTKLMEEGQQKHTADFCYESLIIFFFRFVL